MIQLTPNLTELLMDAQSDSNKFCKIKFQCAPSSCMVYNVYCTGVETTIVDVKIDGRGFSMNPPYIR